MPSLQDTLQVIPVSVSATNAIYFFLDENMQLSVNSFFTHHLMFTFAYLPEQLSFDHFSIFLLLLIRD